MTHDLKGKVALVTGASRGLVAAIARKLGDGGAKVAVNFFANPDKARRVVEQIRQVHGTAEAFKADIREEKEVNALVEQVRRALGAVDILPSTPPGRSYSFQSRT